MPAHISCEAIAAGAVKLVIKHEPSLSIYTTLIA